MPRDITRKSPLGALAKRDFIVDEADDSYDAFPVARALGYRGISSKSCKGVYKSVINAARAAKWSAAGAKHFIAGEDLTCQAGLAVQQDLALGALIGVTHAERNGHHYVDGFAETPPAEAERFLTAHPDLYAQSGGKERTTAASGGHESSPLVSKPIPISPRRPLHATEQLLCGEDTNRTDSVTHTVSVDLTTCSAQPVVRADVLYAALDDRQATP